MPTDVDRLNNVHASLATVVLLSNSNNDDDDSSSSSMVQALVFMASDVSPRVHCVNVNNDRATSTSTSTSASDGSSSVGGVASENSYKGFFFEPILSSNGICDLSSALHYEKKFILVASVSSEGSLAVSLFRTSVFIAAREATVVVSSAIPISPFCTVSADEGSEHFSCVDIHIESGWVYVVAGTREGKVCF